MAGKCRIKVLVDNAQPFWMFVDFQECPRIIDVEQKIQQRCKNVNLKNLFLDGCVLPSNEPTELLRDNDVVHVEAKRCTYDPAESISIRTPKLDRKRKWAEVDGGQSDCEGESEKEKKYREKKGTKDSTGTDTKNKKKSKKQKKLKERKKDEDAEEDDNLLVACDAHHPVTCEEDQSVSKQKNKQKERRVKDKKFSLADELPCVSEEQSAASSEVHKKNGIKDKSETADAAEPVLAESMQKSSNPADVNGSASTNKKRRRRKRKTAVQESTITLNSQGPATHTNIAPAPLRLPKGHQPRSKKLVFSSDEDSVVKESDEADAEQERDDDNGKPSGSERAQIGSCSNSFTSFSESVPAVSSPFSNQTTEIKEGSGDAVNCGLATGMGRVKSTVEVTSAVGVNGYPAQANSSNKANEENEWHSNLQHQDQLAEEQSRKHKTASALEKSVTPVHRYTSGQHQVVHPNLAEYLKMSPEDRGVKLPPYVKAKRLSNGAMLYTRNPVAAVLEQIEHTDSYASSSPFEQSAVHCSEGASPREFGKQWQLDTVSTNKSVIIQNPPGTEKGAHRGGVWESRDVAEAGHCPSDQSCATRTDKDQVVVTVTPLYREYSLFPDLTAAPKVGDRIAYKVLEMGDDYTPGISDYKEAEVIDYDASSQSVTVRLLDNNMTLGKKKPGKFDLPEDERSEEENMVTLELSSMFEPKLMSSA